MIADEQEPIDPIDEEKPKPDPNNFWWAVCTKGHNDWQGPDRNTRSEAEEDAKEHDDDKHDGEQTASIMSTADE
ncbi:hypothetical protein HB774_02640 [Rhizobium leguminosarum bv. viciae]|nr:hypothetical protein HB774_02640 [Rhizobium leguminosarum bv. viciae]